jgi:transcription elongation GreA/GreB family factor/gas vesicle protein
MNSEIQSALQDHKITQKEADKLEKLLPGTSVLNKGWGYGTVARFNFEEKSIVIDFLGKPNHAMEIPFAIDRLEPIGAEHFYTRLYTDKASLREEATKDPISFFNCVLTSLGKLSLERISSTLTETVFANENGSPSPESYKAWWTKNSKTIKESGRFNVPAKRTEPVTLNSQENADYWSTVLRRFDTETQRPKIALALEDIRKHIKAQQEAVGKLVNALSRAARTTRECLSTPAATPEEKPIQDPLSKRLEEVAKPLKEKAFDIALGLILAPAESEAIDGVIKSLRSIANLAELPEHTDSTKNDLSKKVTELLESGTIEEVSTRLAQAGSDSGRPLLARILNRAETISRQNRELALNDVLQLLSIRDEILELFPKGEAPATELVIADLLKGRNINNLSQILINTPAARLPKVVASLPQAFPDQWPQLGFDLLFRCDSRVIGEIAALFHATDDTKRLSEEQKAHKEQLFKVLEEAINHLKIPTSVLMWLLQKSNRRSQSIRNLLTPRAFVATISALEKDLFDENRDRKLHDFLLADKNLVPLFVSSESEDELSGESSRTASSEDRRKQNEALEAGAAAVMRAITASPALDDLNRRTLFDRIITTHSNLSHLLTTDSEEGTELIIVSWTSLERRKNEYDDLVQRRIPDNIRQIQIAREYGDLRENAEYKAAKENEKTLNLEKSRIERELGQARGTDFSDATTDSVSVGTSVTVVRNGETLTFHILGAWDTAPERDIISYRSSRAQELLGKKIGQTCKIDFDGNREEVHITRIERWSGSLG